MISSFLTLLLEKDNWFEMTHWPFEAVLILTCCPKFQWFLDLFYILECYISMAAPGAQHWNQFEKTFSEQKYIKYKLF